MKRKRFNIDNELIIKLIDNNNFSKEVKKALTKWYAYLEDNDIDINRIYAKELLKSIAGELFSKIEFPLQAKDRLIDAFDPLETVLRTADSLKQKPINVRDHLSHTVRVLLFSNYLLEHFRNEDERTKLIVFISAIFHDMAYPIQKLKKVGENLTDRTFSDLLNSEGIVEFGLNNTSKLLEMIHFFNLMIIKIEGEIKEIEKRVQDNVIKEKDAQILIDHQKAIKIKLTHVYKEIITPAIMGQGLFNSPHCLSSVVLFLLPILEEWQNSDAYLSTHIETICDICLTIAYHDRSMNFENFNRSEYQLKEIPLCVKILRIADELQEWDRTREKDDFIKDVSIEIDNDHLDSLCINYQEKNTDKIDCNPYIVITEKINGLKNVLSGSNKIELNFDFPNIYSSLDFCTKLAKSGILCVDTEKPIDYNVIKLIASENQFTLIFQHKVNHLVENILQREIKYNNSKIKEELPISDLFTIDKNNDSETKQAFLNEFNRFYKQFYKSLDIQPQKQHSEFCRTNIEDIWPIFETTPLQTLKGRKQLGLLSKVKASWKNAIHTRYDHSMGVVIKSMIICDYLNSELKIDDSRRLAEKEIRELVLASALHDCGHLPISHAVERAFLSCSDKKEDVTHEARIIPLILGNHPYFEDIRKIASDWKKANKFDNDSLIRVAIVIIGGKNKSKKFNKYIPQNFKYPRTAIIQLLSSEIDLDRLDFVLRDSDSINYKPVKLLEDKILLFMKGISLSVKTKLVGHEEEDVELCIRRNYLPYMFYYLVSRVLLYKFCYFLPEVRGFEAVSTNIVNELLINNVLMNQYQLMAMSDDEFIGKPKFKTDGHLYKLANQIDDQSVKDRLIKAINVIKEGKASRYNLFTNKSIFPKYLTNPRLKEDFANNLNKHSFINKIKKYLIEITENEENPLKWDELQFDVFDMKAGKGDILVYDEDEKKYKILNDFMNGSNIYRLCTETRLDIYYKSDLSEEKKTNIINWVYNIFN